MNDTAARNQMVDQSFEVRQQGWVLTRVVKLANGEVVRVTIQRDSYLAQSFARVEVFTPAYTWTQLAVEPAAAWHGKTPSDAKDAFPAEPVARGLVKRAAAILDAVRAG